MFDHIHTERAAPTRWPILALSVVLTLGALGGLIYGCLLLLSMLGFGNIFVPTRVEVSLDPYGDGTRLEDLVGEDGRPEALNPTASPEFQAPAAAPPPQPEQPPAQE